MFDQILGVLVGFALCKLLAAGSAVAEFFHVTDTRGPAPGAKGGRSPGALGPDVGPKGGLVYSKGPAPSRGTPGTPARATPGTPRPAVLTATAATFPQAKPAGLPAWPSGWQAAKRATPAMVQRAWALLPVLKVSEHKLEAGPGGTWLTYYKSKAPSGKTGVTVYEPKPGAASLASS